MGDGDNLDRHIVGKIRDCVWEPAHYVPMGSTTDGPTIGCHGDQVRRVQNG